eukprot:271013_1
MAFFSIIQMIQYLFAINICASQVCVWYATESSFVNGLYAPDGKSAADVPAYSLQIADTCDKKEATLYLYTSLTGHWTISSVKDATDSESQKGECISTSATTPNECDTKWQIPYGVYQPSVKSDSALKCPHVSCDGLILQYDVNTQNETCIGNFNKHIQANVYQKGSSNIYLYFNPSLFRWVCGDQTGIPNQCMPLSSFIGYASIQSWYNSDKLNSAGKSINLLWNNGHTATIECAGAINHSTWWDNKWLWIEITGGVIGGCCCCVLCFFGLKQCCTHTKPEGYINF